MKIGNMEIHYLTDTPTEYTKSIRAARDLEALRQAIGAYYPFAWDAAEVAAKMTEEDWPDYLLFDKIGRDNRTSSDKLIPLAERFGAIMLPEPMLKVGMVAVRFGAPWGCAAIRLQEEGYLVEDDGKAIVTL